MTSRGVTRDDQQKQHADDSYPQRSDARAAQSEIPRGESGVGGGMTSQNLRGNGDTPTSPRDSSTPSSSRRASTADSGSGVAPDAVPSLSASRAKLDESEMGLPRMHRCSCVLLPVDECAYERGVRDACRSDAARHYRSKEERWTRKSVRPLRTLFTRPLKLAKTPRRLSLRSLTSSKRPSSPSISSDTASIPRIEDDPTGESA